MNKKLDKELCRRYPDIFAERKLSVSESCMGRGFECGDGWFSLINNLCSRLELIKARTGARALALQVKERDGELRFYVKHKAAVMNNAAWEEMLEAAGVARSESRTICEWCGAPGKHMEISGWLVTLCNRHKREYKRSIGVRRIRNIKQ